MALAEIVHFERMLAEEGALILKFWLHLSKKAQKKRLTALAADASTRWRVTAEDWARYKCYDRFRKVSETALRETSTAHATWMVIEGADANYRSLTAGRMLLDALKKRLAHRQPVASRPAALPPAPIDGRTVFSRLDYTARLPQKNYAKKLERYQGELALLTRHKKFRHKSVVVVFEGADAAGKGGRHPAHHRRARCALLPNRADRRTD